jgi:acyl-CoA dehydrogenase
MDFAFDARTEQLRAELLDFMVSHVHPAEPVFAEQLAALDNRWAWSTVPVLGELRERARSRGLWNLFLPGEHGAGLTNLQYAPLAEITGRSPELAPAALNCSAPDTGNMEVLAHFGTRSRTTAGCSRC